MTDRDRPQGPGQGPHDQPHRDAGDPIGNTAYVGDTTLPPTGDLDAEPSTAGLQHDVDEAAEQLHREEDLGPEHRHGG
jgi:hypothetical protein